MRRRLQVLTGAGISLTLVGTLLIAAAGSAFASSAHDHSGLPHGHSRPVCPGSAQTVRCFARVATDVNGRPLVFRQPRENEMVGDVETNGYTFGYSPQNYHSAYGLPWRSPVRQTIALVDAYYESGIKSDLDVFDQTWGLGSMPWCSSTITTACYQQVDQNGYSRSFVNDDAGLAADWRLETEMDVQAARAMCLNCKILLVEAFNQDRKNLATAVNTAYRLGATEISNSYGWAEDDPDFTDWYPSAYSHPGVAITVSTGDSGYGVAYPADLNTVVAVGGTSLYLNSDGSYNSEEVWGDWFGSGTGSGCSAFNSTSTLAATWQRSVAGWSSTGCGAERATADVSADADPNTGFWVYDSKPTEGRPGWFVEGGTSLSSPIISGVYALAGNAGSYNWPAVIPYRNATRLHDVTSGSNGLFCDYDVMCNAGTGYDGPTGLGTPRGTGGF